MASRYNNNPTKKEKSGKIVYQSRIYPAIPLSDEVEDALEPSYDRDRPQIA